MALPTRSKDVLPSVDTNTHDIDQLFTPTILIKVGLGIGAKEYNIHRGLLKFYSGYFRSAITNIESGNFAEAEKGIINLPDEDVPTFELFMRWLYAYNRKLTKEDNPDWRTLQTIHLCQLWCFADQRLIPMLQNRVIDLIISKLSQNFFVSLVAVRFAYEKSGSGSALRRIFSFSHAQQSFKVSKGVMVMEEEAKKAWFQEWCADLGLERIDQLMMKGVTPDRCTFHVHEPGVGCADKEWKVYLP